MPSLGLVMIVRDEAAVLPRCLESVSAIADAMYVGDTGSTDDTVSIARSFNAEVFHVPWQDDFAAARNQVLAKARTDWLLHLDADEVLDPGNAARIRAIVDADGHGADAIEVIMANYGNDFRAPRWTPVDAADPFAHGFAGYIAAPLIRVFRNGRGYAYQEAVHENLTESIMAHGGIIRAEPIHIHHYGHDPLSTRGQAKTVRYVAMARKKAESHPADPKAWYDLAELSLLAGDAALAEDAARRSLVLAPDYMDAAVCLAKLLLNRGAIEEGRDVLESLLALGTAPPQVTIALGAIALRQGRLASAVTHLDSAIAQSPRHPLALYYRARAADLQESPGEARTWFARAAAAAPGPSEFSRALEAHDLRRQGEQLAEADLLEAALAQFAAALLLDPEDALAHNAAGVIAAHFGRTSEARRCFERALRLAPSLECARENLRMVAGE